MPSPLERFLYGAEGKPPASPSPSGLAGLTCGGCGNLDKRPIDSGLRYCWRHMNWRGPTADACLSFSVQQTHSAPFHRPI